MPPIKRYFKVNQDINADPKSWELTDRFGLSGLRIWLEILSIADRNKGILPGPIEAYPSILAGRTKSTWKHVRAVLEWLRTRSRDGQKGSRYWLEVNSEGIGTIPKWWKYNRTREADEIPSGEQKKSLLAKPSEPSLPKEALKSQEALKNRIGQTIGTMSNGNGEKAKALQAWITNKRDLIVNDPDGLELIAQTLERLKTREGNGTEVKSYGRYLDTLYSKVRTEWQQGEASRLNDQRKEGH